MHCKGLMLHASCTFTSFNGVRAMFSIANLLDSAKAKAGINSDYQLAKLIAINQSAVTNYRSGRSLPDDSVLLRLCALSGDDPALIAAHIQSRRAATEETRQMWQRVAARLQVGAVHVCILLAAVFIALSPDMARATTAQSQTAGAVVCILCKVYRAIHRWLLGLHPLTIMRA